MIYKCSLCGSLNKLDEDNFETYSPASFIEHLQSHIDECMDTLEIKDEEIENLKRQLIVAKQPSVNYLDKPTKTDIEPKHRSRVPFDDKIKEILMQYYQFETAKELQQRIKDEAGKSVHISSIYGWIAKQKYNEKVRNGKQERK